MSAIYLAARYSRHAEMREIRGLLHALGHTVTSRWIDLHGGEQLESATAEALLQPDSVDRFAREDIEDIERADVVISFTGGGRHGGRHVEFGYALAMHKRLVLIGERENVFHALPDVNHYETWSAFLADGVPGAAPSGAASLDWVSAAIDALERFADSEGYREALASLRVEAEVGAPPAMSWGWNPDARADGFLPGILRVRRPVHGVVRTCLLVQRSDGTVHRLAGDDAKAVTS